MVGSKSKQKRQHCSPGGSPSHSHGSPLRGHEVRREEHLDAVGDHDHLRSDVRAIVRIGLWDVQDLLMNLLQRLLLYMCEAFLRLMPKGRGRGAHLQKLAARVRPQLLD